MAGPWQNYPHSFGMYPSYYTTTQNAPHFTPTTGYYGSVIPFQQPMLDRLHTGLPEFDDLNRSVLPAQGSNRIRRRINAGGEHVKFRRTRSGCYTCRNRRVKVCSNATFYRSAQIHVSAMRHAQYANVSSERLLEIDFKLTFSGCRKGNRECVYPEPPSSAKTRRDSNKSRSGREGEGDGSSVEDGDFDDLMLEDDDNQASGFEELDGAVSADGQGPEARASTDPPHLHNSSPSPSIEAASPLARAQTSTPVSQSTRSSSRPRVLAERRIQDLPEDIRFYLQYASTRMSHHHWGVRLDHQNFFRRTMIELALRYDPLLYALVGFAAYHCTIEKPDGKLGDFLGYYQKSVTLLRQTFRHKPTIATVLTILQLATIEVRPRMLVDWVD